MRGTARSYHTLPCTLSHARSTYLPGSQDYKEMVKGIHLAINSTGGRAVLRGVLFVQVGHYAGHWVGMRGTAGPAAPTSPAPAETHPMSC